MLRNGLPGLLSRPIVLRLAVRRVALLWIATRWTALWRTTLRWPILRWITLLWLSLLRCAHVVRLPLGMRLRARVRPSGRVLRTGLFVRMWRSAALLWILPGRQLLPRLRTLLRSDERSGLQSGLRPCLRAVLRVAALWGACLWRLRLGVRGPGNLGALRQRGRLSDADL